MGVRGDEGGSERGGGRVGLDLNKANEGLNNDGEGTVPDDIIRRKLHGAC